MEVYALIALALVITVAALAFFLIRKKGVSSDTGTGKVNIDRKPPRQDQR